MVREEAVESFKIIIKELSGNDVSKEVISVLQELTEGDWFTSRISACGIFAVAYQKLENDADQNRIRELFGTLCNDDTPMVRRAAANSLGDLAHVMNQETIINELLPQFRVLVGDDQDSVRLITIEHCKDLASRLSQERNVEFLLPIIRNCSEDKSWKVRQTIAKDYGLLAKSIGPEKTTTELMPYLINFLNDPEGEVKCSAVKNVKSYDLEINSRFLDLIGPDLLKKADLFEFLTRLSKDSTASVKVELANTCMQLGVSVPKEVTPIIQILLSEENPEVIYYFITRSEFQYYRNSTLWLSQETLIVLECCFQRC